ncbi:MAG: formylglycine-generating enzyme family protein, partial [Magnetovibrio sp.]|nr:formylglycine-generating enzyme family protein [Magnetovibrio sp.]
VQIFLKKLSAKTKQTYRLLSEAEWEYAARAGTTTKWSCGKKKTCVKDISWYKGISNKTSHRVGLKQPNAFGLYDMAGNVREWTADCYQANHQGAPKDGTAVQSHKECHKRTVRGGSWSYLPRDHRSANRHRVFVTFKLNDLGFRVARIP